MNILCFGAHPDDCEAHCAGTLAKYAKAGHKVYMAIATNGEIGSYGMTREEIAKMRYEESKRAAEIIGAELIWMGFEDEMLFDNRETRMAFIEVVRYCRPDVIFAHTPFKDYNQDHDICGYLAFQARILATVKLMETKSPVIDHIPPMFYYASTGWLSMAHEPQYFVDITDTHQTKIDSLKAHASQMGDWDKDAFGTSVLQMIINSDLFYGSACGTPGVNAVESFRLCTDWPVIAGAHKLLP